MNITKNLKGKAKLAYLLKKYLSLNGFHYFDNDLKMLKYNKN